MQKTVLFACLLSLGTGCATSQPPALADPMLRAHAHNDYEHDRPLLDALDHGFCSVEADIHLVDGELLVAHDRDQVKPGRTLQALYLAPLQQRVKANAGAVHPGGTRFILLIDIKSGAKDTYLKLAEVLAGYEEMLTTYTPDKTMPGAVTVIVSGARPTGLMAREPKRLAGVDGRLSDLRRDTSKHLMPLISDHWGRAFKWNGRGEMPDDVRKKLHGVVKECHARGQLLRFWATPESPELWAELLAAGVDLINTDDLAGLEAFLMEQASARK